MKTVKRIMSVFMVCVLFVSMMTTALYASAADYSFKKFINAITEDTDFVRDLSHYKSSSDADTWNDEASNVAYANKVTAYDNPEGLIATAAKEFYALVDHSYSTQYDNGNYTLELLYNYFCKELEAQMTDEIRVGTDGNRYVSTEEIDIRESDEIHDIELNKDDRLTAVAIGYSDNDEYTLKKSSYQDFNWSVFSSDVDGLFTVDNTGRVYVTYAEDDYMDMNGKTAVIRAQSIEDPRKYDDIIVRCVIPENFELDTGRVPTIPAADSDEMKKREGPEVIYKTMYEFSHASSLVANFLGGATVTNTANWFCTYAFTVETDKEAALLDKLGTQKGDVTYSIVNYTGDVKLNKETYTWLPHVRGWDESGTIVHYTLANGGYKYKNDSTVDNTSIPRLFEIDQAFPDYLFNTINAAGPTLTNEACISGYAGEGYDELIAELKGYSNTFLTAVFGNKVYAIMAADNLIRPNYAYDQAKADSRLNEQYYLYRTVRNGATYKITQESATKLIKNIDSLLTSEDVGKILPALAGVLDEEWLSGNVTTAQDLVKNLLSSLVYQDSIVNALFGALMPMLGELLFDPEGDVIGAVASLTGIGFLDDALAEGVEGLFNDLGLRIKTPKTMVEGNMGNETLSAEFAEAKAYLASCNTWADVDFDQVHWNINGNKQKFLDAVGYAFTPLTYAAWALFGDGAVNGKAKVSIITLYAHVIETGLYDSVIVPLLYTLGVPASFITPTAEYYRMVEADNQRSTSRGVFITEILKPIIRWAEEEIAAHPLQTVLTILPNLSYALTSGQIVNMLGKNGDGAFKLTVSLTQGGTGIDIGQFLDSVIGNCTLYGILDANNVAVSGINITDLVDPTKSKTVTVSNGAGSTTTQTFQLGSVDGIIKALLSETFDCKMIDYSKQEGDKPGYDRFGDPIYIKGADGQDVRVAVYLPTFPDVKLQSCGVPTLKPDANGDNRTFYTVNSAGMIFIFILRYALYGMMYNINNGDWTNMTLMNHFVSAGDYNNEAFLGITWNELFSNLVLHPEEVICALYEIFVPNREAGEIGPYQNNVTSDSVGYNIGSGSAIKNVYYQEYPDYLAEYVKGKSHFGTEVRYTKYWTKEYAEEVATDLDVLVDNVLVMLKLDDIEIAGKPYSLGGGIEGFVDELLEGLVFSNDILSKIASALYTLLGGLAESTGIDLDLILSVVLNNMHFNTQSFYSFLYYESTSKHLKDGVTVKAADRSEVLKTVDAAIAAGENFSESMFYHEDGTARDWGLDDTKTYIGKDSTLKLTKQDLFVDCLCAIVAPAAELFRIIILGKDLSPFFNEETGTGLLTINFYEMWQYVFIPLFEALGIKSNNIPSFDKISRDSVNDEILDADLDLRKGDVLLFEDFLQPVVGLINQLKLAPIDTVFTLIPNLMYYILSGALVDTLNNLLHFAYVLLDIVSPILNVYEKFDDILASFNLDLSQYGLGNLALPLDIDVNGLVNNLLGSYLVGNAFTFDALDAPLTITIPNLDLSMLCVGTPNIKQDTASGIRDRVVELSNGTGAELITVILQFAMKVLFSYQNWMNIADWLTESQALDKYDATTLHDLLSTLNTFLNEKEAPDLVLYVLYFLITKLTALSGPLAQRFKLVDFGLLDIFGGDDMLGKIVQLVKANENPSQTAKAASSFLERLIAFFKKIVAWFKNIF